MHRGLMVPRTYDIARFRSLRPLSSRFPHCLQDIVGIEFQSRLENMYHNNEMNCTHSCSCILCHCGLHLRLILSYIQFSAIVDSEHLIVHVTSFVHQRNPLMHQSVLRIVAAIATKGHILSHITTL